MKRVKELEVEERYGVGEADGMVRESRSESTATLVSLKPRVVS